MFQKTAKPADHKAKPPDQTRHLAVVFFKFIVNPRKLENEFRRISAGIPSTLA